jgi:TonB family protein
MKPVNFNSVAAVLALLCCCVVAAGAQGVPSSWVKVAPAGEAFSVMMPGVPAVEEERKSIKGFYVSGRRYRVKDSGDAIYTVWSFKPTGMPDAAQADTEDYLDLCAELAWDILIRGGREQARSEAEYFGGDAFWMIYQRALTSPAHPGRNYTLAVGKRRGATQIYVAGAQFYIVTALGEASEPSNPEIFMKSFSLGAPPPSPEGDKPLAEGGGSGNGAAKEGATKSDSPPDDSKPVATSGLTRQARIRSKPEASYTAAASRFRVGGTVRVRFLLTASGKVSDITPLTKLPHGLTQKAVEAAKKITFEPAMKDGRRVSQYFVIDYNFNNH